MNSVEVEDEVTINVPLTKNGFDNILATGCMNPSEEIQLPLLENILGGGDDIYFDVSTRFEKSFVFKFQNRSDLVYRILLSSDKPIGVNFPLDFLTVATKDRPGVRIEFQWKLTNIKYVEKEILALPNIDPACELNDKLCFINSFYYDELNYHALNGPFIDRLYDNRGISFVEAVHKKSLEITSTVDEFLNLVYPYINQIGDNDTFRLKIWKDRIAKYVYLKRRQQSSSSFSKEPACFRISLGRLSHVSGTREALAPTEDQFYFEVELEKSSITPQLFTSKGKFISLVLESFDLTSLIYKSIDEFSNAISNNYDFIHEIFKRTKIHFEMSTESFKRGYEEVVAKSPSRPPPIVVYNKYDGYTGNGVLDGSILYYVTQLGVREYDIGKPISANKLLVQLELIPDGADLRDDKIIINTIVGVLIPRFNLEPLHLLRNCYKYCRPLGDNSAAGSSGFIIDNYNINQAKKICNLLPSEESEQQRQNNKKRRLSVGTVIETLIRDAIGKRFTKSAKESGNLSPVYRSSNNNNSGDEGYDCDFFFQPVSPTLLQPESPPPPASPVQSTTTTTNNNDDGKKCGTSKNNADIHVNYTDLKDFVSKVTVSLQSKINRVSLGHDKGGHLYSVDEDNQVDSNSVDHSYHNAKYQAETDSDDGDDDDHYLEDEWDYLNNAVSTDGAAAAEEYIQTPGNYKQVSGKLSHFIIFKVCDKFPGGVFTRPVYIFNNYQKCKSLIIDDHRFRESLTCDNFTKDVNLIRIDGFLIHYYATATDAAGSFLKVKIHQTIELEFTKDDIIRVYSEDGEEKKKKEQQYKQLGGDGKNNISNVPSPDQDIDFNVLVSEENLNKCRKIRKDLWHSQGNIDENIIIEFDVIPQSSFVTFENPRHRMSKIKPDTFYKVQAIMQECIHVENDTHPPL